MDLNRLSMDLSAALEESQRIAAKAGLAYIQGKHLLLALLDPKGSLGKTAGKLGLDAAKAYQRVESAPDGPDGAKAEPGRKPVAGRTLRDLFDRATAVADKKGAHTIGPLEVALAAVTSDQGNLGPALRDAGWTADKLTAALDSPVVMQPAEEEKAAEGGSVLAKYTKDLTQTAREGKLMPVVGRDAETRSVIQTLLRKTKNNPAKLLK